MDWVSEQDECQRLRARMFSFPVGGGWPQMASRGVSHAALGLAAVRAVLFIRLAAQVCSRKGS